jgi:hypothetical protein
MGEGGTRIEVRGNGFGHVRFLGATLPCRAGSQQKDQESTEQSHGIAVRILSSCDEFGGFGDVSFSL